MNLKFEKVDTQEKLEAWKKFAAEFGHDQDNPYMPIVTVSEGGEMFGYWSTLAFPVLMPAFHTDKTTPRRFVEMVKAISNASQISSLSYPQHPNGACFAALESSPAIDESIIRKLGFEDTGLKLWRKVS
jgi:hypothetical protein